MEAKQGDKKALDKIIDDNINLVRFVANKYTKRGLEYEDLVQEGIIGLIKAINKCDLKRSTSFSTYAVYWIRQSINLAIINQGRPISLPFDTFEKLLKIENAIFDYKNKFGIEPTLDEVAAKTGTVQSDSTSTNNGVFVCYAPYETPEIAMSIVVEKGGSGSSLITIAKKILTSFFTPSPDGSSISGENALLR